MINGLDSLARRSIVNDLRWFLFILNSVFIFLFRSFLHFVSFRFSCDLTFAVWFVCASEQSSWLFIHDQCQMQANELRLFKTKKHRTDSTANLGIFPICFSVCDSSIFHDTLRETGWGECSWKHKTNTKLQRIQIKDDICRCGCLRCQTMPLSVCLSFVCAHCQASDSYHSW